MLRKFNYIAISNNVDDCALLEVAGVQQIMVDAEIIGKVERQKHKNTIISDHTIKDVEKLKNYGIKSEIICRINPYHENIFDEINLAISCGTDAIMLPMITSITHYQQMVTEINDRCKIIPLIETPYSFFKIDEILEFSDLTQIHFGLNDLSIALGNKNLFEILTSRTFENITTDTASRIKLLGIGGVGTPLKKQIIKPELIFNQYYRLGSRSVILSRSFFTEGYHENDIVTAIEILENSLDKNFTKASLIEQVENFF